MKNPRFMNTDTCIGCNACKGNERCAEARRDDLSPYGGIRYTADGFDCALPVSVDSHSVCSYGCLYCFSDNLVVSRAKRAKPIGETSLKALESIFSGGGGKDAELYRMALRYDRKKNGYPCPIQLGAICDPCDNIERQQGWLLEFIKLAIKYNQPVRMSTKGNVLLMPEYQRELSKAPHLFWVAFSIITSDDDLIEKIDRNAPNATMRIKVMKQLSKLGVKTSLRFRPMMPGVSDSTPRIPIVYKDLIEKCAAAGAGAISYEVMFMAGAMTKDLKFRWNHIEEITGIKYQVLYKTFGKNMACMRPPYTWTENIMHAVKEEAIKNKMTVGVSDPVWKQLGETGCCCGILPDDPVFGNWQPESATNQLLIAKNTGKELGLDDVTPAWARKKTITGIAAPGVGPTIVYSSRHNMWSDFLAKNWNNLSAQRSPLNYFQGALYPPAAMKKEIYFINMLDWNERISPIMFGKYCLLKDNLKKL